MRWKPSRQLTPEPTRDFHVAGGEPDTDASNGIEHCRVLVDVAFARRE
jgi:hypothetical protein